MADKRFFLNSGPFTLAELASASGSTLLDKAAGNRSVRDVAPLESATADDISFLDNTKYIDAFRATKAGACIIRQKFAEQAPKGVVLLVAPNPYHAYAIIASMFYAPYRPRETSIHPTAVIHETAKIGEQCEIGAYVTLGANVRVGSRTAIHAGAHLADGVEVGEDCTIHSGANISHSIIGNRVIIHHGTAIGQDGFGFATSAAGKHEKVPQLGRVLIKDDVEIGANTAIDRGSGPDTIIGENSKIDNLVQIGHNVVLGQGCIVVAQVGISGSTKAGDYVAFGGQAGITGHLTIGSGARIAGKSGVMRDVAPGETVVGSPAVPARQHHRQIVVVQKLAEEGSNKEGKKE